MQETLEMQTGVGSCLAVLMPVYNEQKTVCDILHKVMSQSLVREIIVVDDGSTDGTWDVLQQYTAYSPRVKLFRHAKNCGKGAALRTALSHATAPIVLIQDADLEYDPCEYSALLRPILEGKADAVFGSRFIFSGSRRVLYYWHSLGNWLLTSLSNMATNLNLTDMETCYKAVRLDIMKRITIQEDRFGVEAEITAKLARLGARIYEVPISYHGRTYAEGKKIRWTDGMRTVWCIIKYNFLVRQNSQLPLTK